MSNDSERLDGDVLGEDVGDDGLPGVGDYPPDSARGVNDPNLVGPDDVAMRSARERSEPGPDDVAAGTDPVADLLPPDGDSDLRDDVQQAVATLSDVAADESDRAPVAAEVDAVRVVGD